MADISVNSNNFNYNNYNTATAGTTQTRGVGGGTEVQRTGLAENAQAGSLSGPSAAGELPYQAAGVNGTDWDALTNDLATSANLMVSLGAIMTLLIEVMSQMRQDQREVALADAQNALQSGLNAADAQKKAAAFALASGLASGAVSMASGGYSAYKSAGQINDLKGAQAEVNKAAGMKEGPDRDAAMNEANAKFKMTDLQVNAQTAKIQGYTQLGRGASDMLGSFMNFFAESARAEAKTYETEAQYEQSLQQADQAFFQQLGDSIRALMQSWQSADRSTHEASQAIYNV